MMKPNSVTNPSKARGWLGAGSLPLLYSLCLIQSAGASDFDFAAPACPAGGSGDRIAYLSEEIPGTCNDVLEVQSLIFELGQTGTLIVDKTCILDGGLRLPSRFTLKGTGIGSAGVLAFDHDGIALSACQETPRSYLTIADLDLYGPYRDGDAVGAPHSIGIALANHSLGYLTRVRVSDFHDGVIGTNSYSIFINGSNISNNERDNIRIGYASNGWRIRDGVVSQGGRWGINVLGPGDARPLEIRRNEIWNTSNDLLIDGVRLESNATGGIRSNAYATRVTNARLEFNGHGTGASGYHGVLVDSGAEQTRLLSNLFSSNCIEDLGLETERAFNIDANC